MLQPRPPIVVVLGHVDHGKTSLLDKIRSTNVAARESGGITQHIGAYQVTLSPKSEMSSRASESSRGTYPKITFIDTPGHAAFGKMRSRGGSVADIAILVVAATDGVMPQTKEAIQIIQKLKLPTIVAANKTDLPEASVDKLKSQLAENNVIPEDYGGDVPVIPLSAKTGQGIPDLLEMISLINELHPTKADPEGDFEGVVIESRLDKNRGPVATVLVKNGTLHTSDEIYAEKIKAKVKSMTDDTAKQLSEVPPGKPVEILGFVSVPPVGSVVTSKPTEPSPVTAVSPVSSAAPVLKIILKADVAGSLEALTQSLSLPGLQLISATTGDITESDVLEAVSHKARIVGFNTRAPGSVAKLAETENVSIKTYTIIYELLEDIEKQIQLLLNPELNEEVLGQASIMAIFPINSDKVAGSKLLTGKITRGDKVHIRRGQETLFDSRIKSLKKAKDDIPEVTTGEFGAIFSPSVDFAVGDAIIAFRKLE